MSKQIRNKVIKNKLFLNQYEELINFEKLSKKEQDKIHMEK